MRCCKSEQPNWTINSSVANLVSQNCFETENTMNTVKPRREKRYFNIFYSTRQINGQFVCFIFLTDLSIISILVLLYEKLYIIMESHVLPFNWWGTWGRIWWFYVRRISIKVCAISGYVFWPPKTHRKSNGLLFDYFYISRMDKRMGILCFWTRFNWIYLLKCLITFFK